MKQFQIHEASKLFSCLWADWKISWFRTREYTIFCKTGVT
jgi:hypothetical protein